jgi:hypothetical protein
MVPKIGDFDPLKQKCAAPHLIPESLSEAF